MATALLDRTGPPATSGSRPDPTIVTVDAVHAWPNLSGRRDLPILTVVLAEPARITDAGLLLLLDLIEDRRGTGQAATLTGDHLWTLVPGTPPTVKLAIRAKRPCQLELDLLLPAGPLANPLRRLARGGTITLTTRAHTDPPRPGLTGHVLVPCPPSTVLARAAHAAGLLENAVHRRTG